MATTVTSGFSASILRHFRAVMATSFIRSSWSRLRLPSKMTRGFVAAVTIGRYASFDLEHGGGIWGPLASVVTTPDVMFAPVAAVTTGLLLNRVC